MFEGSAVALITPFKDGAVDFPALEKLIDFHVAAETECILVCGTTGESATLTHEEHKEIIRHAAAYIRSVRGHRRFPLLMAGTGSNSTREALELTQAAKDFGADAALLIAPYYNKPTQAGLLYHFQTIARQVDIPQVPYNIQSRTGVNINVETVVELAQEKNIVGIKEASGNLTQISEIARLTPPDFYVWSGDDGLTLPILAVGGRGVISVTANIAPKPVRALVHAYLKGDTAEALRLHRQLAGLNQALFLETNPIPVKTAVNRLSRSPESGLPYCGDLRPPLVPMARGNEDKLMAVLADFGFPVV
ncbi:MAG TPA: 4-hydroxy-tetrahydrodipicolinate synthase [bacterium]|nr:4-hydroxy-tetrahydrodipicolinate synthase [Candidatus Omnitrophota bacterium]HOJ61380.1 4-hydroxy-tetrahydrodipicolinate synthase [bacterium]HOL95966.1 4-hydroxy-tetrahydrodipicolinate synthase [bacterium]HPP01644.1 4-hydroxy-tetrahydrodipicolinate synthase [bacterium]